MPFQTHGLHWSHYPPPISHPFHPISLEANLLLDFLGLALILVVVLSGIGNLVLQHLDELVEDDGNDGADARTNPVDPMLAVEDAGHDARAEAACGIERAAGVVDADELGDEERKADTNGCDECCCDVSVMCFEVVVLNTYLCVSPWPA